MIACTFCCATLCVLPRSCNMRVLDEQLLCHGKPIACLHLVPNTFFLMICCMSSGGFMSCGYSLLSVCHSSVAKPVHASSAPYSEQCTAGALQTLSFLRTEAEFSVAILVGILDNVGQLWRHSLCVVHHAHHRVELTLQRRVNTRCERVCLSLLWELAARWPHHAEPASTSRVIHGECKANEILQVKRVKVPHANQQL